MDVQYVPNIEDYNIGKEETNAGLVKEINGCDDNGNLRKWDIESETRIRVALKPKAFECYLDDENEVCYPKPNFKYLYLKLSGVKLDITEYNMI